MSDEPKIPQAKEMAQQQLAQSTINRIKKTTDNEKRLQIIQSIASIEDPWAVNVLLDSLADKYEDIRRFIVDFMAQNDKLDISLLYERLSKPPWYAKIEVLKILGLRKNPLSAKHIEIVLQEPSVDVRKTAAEVLGQIGGKDALAILAKLTKDENPFVRKAAEKSLNATSDLKFL
ncbi:MAG: HEAT repeat domain-containing protein [Candidatus Aminicenantes bacterium]|jgi:HEAT repeat protein